MVRRILLAACLLLAPPAYLSGSQAPSKVWDNYDFAPGSRVVFYTDFSEDRVGNFARRLKLLSGAMDVVERDGVKMLRATSRSMFLIPVGKKLPQRFTLEIDILLHACFCAAQTPVEAARRVCRLKFVKLLADAHVQGTAQIISRFRLQQPARDARL